MYWCNYSYIDYICEFILFGQGFKVIINGQNQADHHGQNKAIFVKYWKENGPILFILKLKIH